MRTRTFRKVRLWGTYTTEGFVVPFSSSIISRTLLMFSNCAVVRIVSGRNPYANLKQI